MGVPWAHPGMRTPTAEAEEVVGLVLGQEWWP